VKGQIAFRDVSKVYRWRGPRRRHETLKGVLFGRRGGGVGSHEHLALDGIDFEISAGEAVALVGPNGSGKSTVLKLAGGILQPTSGSVHTEGRITALIELGAGFHPEITGRENIVINGMLLGLSRSEISERMDEIVAFADIGDLIDQPVKVYSSGMYVRLGFAVAVAAEPDILLIDEVLAVGDESFTRRCLDRLARMRQRGVTMVLVSHDLDLVAGFSDRALYLERSRVVADGPSDAVVARYRSDAAAGVESTQDSQALQRAPDDTRWGNGDIEITDVEVMVGDSRQRLIPSGSRCKLCIRYRVVRPTEDFVFGVAWHRDDGAHVSGHNTEMAGFKPRRLAEDGEVCCVYDAVPLAPGPYLIDVAVHSSSGLAYDYWCDAVSVQVTASEQWPGVWAPPIRWRSSGPEWEDDSS
jgi:ABC-type polysaccharide/polyol phosphate transport system ATPase subunit